VADEHSSYERLVDAFVHAPVGFALYARDTAPGFARLFVARGREELERQRHQVDTQVSRARTMGRFALAYGPPMVRQRVEHQVERARDLADSLLTGLFSDAAPSPPRAPESASDLVATADSSADPQVDPRGSGDRIETYDPGDRVGEGTQVIHVDTNSHARVLPIPDYDELSASQVVERLDGLTPPDLDAIAQYEATHRGRRTILGKIEQLTV